MWICNGESNLIPKNRRDSNRDSKFPNRLDFRMFAGFSLRTNNAKKKMYIYLSIFGEDINLLFILRTSQILFSCTNPPCSFSNFAICVMYEEQRCQQKEPLSKGQFKHNS